MSHGRKGVWLLSLLLAFTVLPGRALALAPGDLLKPVGRAVAIELDTEGVIVAGLAQVETEAGERSPAGEAGLRTGDRITAVNGRNVHTGEEFLAAVEALGEEDVLLTACRDGKEETFTVEPVRGQDGGRYLGLWLRSSISGIGTVTFQDPESGYFGALGHGVCLEGDNSLMPVSGGAIAPASVSDVAKGERGCPGALVGVPEGGETLGSVEKNTDHGIFGVARPLETGEPPCGGDALPAAGEGEIKKGQATILSNVEGCALSDAPANAPTTCSSNSSWPQPLTPTRSATPTSTACRSCPRPTCWSCPSAPTPPPCTARPWRPSAWPPPTAGAIRPASTSTSLATAKASERTRRSAPAFSGGCGVMIDW